MKHFSTTDAYKASKLKESKESWTQADLVLQDIPLRESPIGVRGENLSSSFAGTSLADAIAAYAKEVGEGESTINYQRRIAIAWPKKHRNPKASWGAHGELMSHPKRFTLIKQVTTVSEARKKLNKPGAWGERTSLDPWGKLDRAADLITGAYEITQWDEWKAHRYLVERRLASSTVEGMMRDLEEILVAIEHFEVDGYDLVEGEEVPSEFEKIINRNYGRQRAVD